ncbi:serine/threonine protein kinase [Plasmodium sp. gorilla clade G3]|nr:serine/threonine protein kinase [Plasmodium sp. gorilla clade G3]
MSFSNTCSLSNNSNSSSSSEEATSGKLQYTESDDEGSDEYCEGGYHPVKINEIYNDRYRIEGKLGWGHFSTVWVATDLKSKPLKFVAIKIQKGSETYTESAKCEINYLNTVKVNSFDSSWVELKEQQRERLFHYNMTKGVVSFIDSFEHKGPNGTHICMVFEFMGPNLLSLIKHYDYKGIPLNLVRKIATHVLIGMQYLHDVCKIIHSDIKPENVLVSPLTTIPKPKDYTKDKLEPNKSTQVEINENDKNVDKKLIITMNNNINTNPSEKNEFINDTKRNDKNIEYDEKYTRSKENVVDNVSFVNDPSDTNQTNNLNNNITDNNNILNNMQIEKQSTISKNEKNEKDSYININNSLENDDQNYKREDMQYNDNKEAINKYDILNIKNNVSTKEKINDCNSLNENTNMNNHNQCEENSINIFNNKNNNIQTNNSIDNTVNEKTNNISIQGMSSNTQNNHDSEKNNVVYEQQLVSEDILKKKTKKKKKKYINEPPYVKHKLRPSNSDPSLLTSYSNIHALQETLTRKPYHYNTYFLNNPEKYRDNKMNPYLHRLPNDYLKKIDQDESDETDETEEEDDHSDVDQNKNQNKNRLEGNLPNSKCPKSNEVYKFFEKDINKFPIYCDMFNHLIHPEALRLHELYMKNKKNIDSNNTMNDLGNNQNSHKVVYINTEDGDYCIRPYDPSVYYHEKSCYKICDLGNSLWIDESRYAEIQTRQYRAPEVILKSGFNETADIWSFACMVFELVTGDFLFNPQKGDRYDKNEEHLSFIIEVLGNIPKHMIDAGYNSHKYFNKNNYRLKNIRNIKRYGLYKILKYKYNLPEKEISPLCSFLLPMLSVDPQTRPSAYTMLQHPWLNMVSLEEGDDMYINDESYSINNDRNLKNNSNSNNFIYDDHNSSKNKNSSNKKKIDVNYKIDNNANNAYNDHYYNKDNKNYIDNVVEIQPDQYMHANYNDDVVEQRPDPYVHANYSNDVVHAILYEKPYSSNNVISHTNNKGHKNNFDINYSQHRNDNNSNGKNISSTTNDYTFNSDYIANMMDHDTYREHIIKNIPAHQISKLKDDKNCKAYNESIQYEIQDFKPYHEHDFEYKYNKTFEQPHYIKGMKHNDDDYEEEEDEDDDDDEDEEDADNDEDEDDEDYESDVDYDNDEYDEGHEHDDDQDEQDNDNEKQQEQQKYGEEYNYEHYENKMGYNKNIQQFSYTNNNDDENNFCEAQKNIYILQNKRDINFKECTPRNNIKKYQSSKIIHQKDNYWNYQIKENTKLREHAEKQHYSNNNNNNIMDEIETKDQTFKISHDLSTNNNMDTKHGALQKMDINQKTNQDKPLIEEENLFENTDAQNVNKINCKVINKKTSCAYT